LHIFPIDVKTLLLPNYYVQSSINYIINIIENIYVASIAKWLHICRSSIFWAGQIFNCTALQTAHYCFNIYTRILSTLPWRCDAEMCIANSLYASV